MGNALSRARGSQTYSAFESYDVGISWAVRRMFARLEGRAVTIRRLLEENRHLRGDVAALAGSFEMERQIAEERLCRCSKCHHSSD